MSNQTTDTLNLRNQRQPTNSLPLLLSSFIGREREMAEVRQMLSTHRLLTLTGPGGCGKTRLAFEVAASLVEHFEDNVWLVELAALSDAALVPQAVVSTLGLREQPERTLTETLTDFLRSKAVLLVLDNCEHLIAACATLADTLLRSCSNLHILATSREALSVAGEIAWLVPSLSLPKSQQLPPPDSLMQYDAIHLFVDRVVDTVPTFTLTKQNAPIVVQLCQKLDGIPLAIELAAARVKVLSVEQIVNRLDSAFHLLTTGSRTALPRQQTLRATIDWSYDLLTEKEQILFRRLAVIAGGFTLEIVEEICSGEGIEQHEVLELLSQLVNKSLFVVVEQGAETRYQLLETVRQYALEKLYFSGEAPTLRQRHAYFFLSLAETSEPKLRSAERRIWQDRLEAEHDNLRAALWWARANAETEMGFYLAGILTWFWYFQGYFSEARQWLEALLTQPGAWEHTQARAKALFGAGAVAWTLGDYPSAYARLDESVSIWRDLTDKQGLAYALTLLGLVTELQGGHAAACLLQEESVALFRQIGDKWGLALALYWFGDTMRVQRDHSAARSLFEESMAIFRETKDKWGLALPLQGLGAVAYRQGDYDMARSRLEEALMLRREVGDKWLIAQSLNTLGVVIQRQGDYAQATALFAESLALYRELGDTLGITASLRNLESLTQHQKETTSTHPAITQPPSI